MIFTYGKMRIGEKVGEKMYCLNFLTYFNCLYIFFTLLFDLLTNNDFIDIKIYVEKIWYILYKNLYF